MIPILLALALLMQGPTALQSETGSVTGVLKTSEGLPAAGVRVTAMAITDSAPSVAIAGELVSLAATDEVGRFRLENIPPGRYYISAGRVDLPTFFPGTLDRLGGTIVSITPRAALTELNFALQDSSIVRSASMAGSSLTLALPIQVVVENGGKQPVSADGKFVTINFAETTGLNNDIRLDRASFGVPVPPGGEYRVTLSNLPDGYALKSMTYGSANLMTGTFKAPGTNLQPMVVGGLGTVVGLSTLPNNEADLLAYLTQLAQLRGGTTTINLTNGGPVVTAVPSSVPAPVSGNQNAAIVVTLGTLPPSVILPQGVRVAGKAPAVGSWSIYCGEVPGVFYADGSFEFRGVPPGRHIILLEDDSIIPHSYHAGFVDVGERDLDGVTLGYTGTVHNSMLLQPASDSFSEFQRSTSHALAGLLGRIVEVDGRTPVSQGSVTVLGKSMATILVNNDGRFIIPRLLPGSYDLRIEADGHDTLFETVVIGEKNVMQDFKVRNDP